MKKLAKPQAMVEVMMAGRRHEAGKKPDIGLEKRRASKRIARAGLDFDVQVSGVDEAALKQAHSGTAKDLALALAEAKASAVYDVAPRDGLIIGADQMLECDGALYDKPGDMDEARANLLTFRGKTHFLVGAVALIEMAIWCGRIVAAWRLPCAISQTPFSTPIWPSRAGNIEFGRLLSIGGLRPICLTPLTVIISRFRACRYCPCLTACAHGGLAA